MPETLSDLMLLPPCLAFLNLGSGELILILVLLLAFLAFPFWIWMLVDCFTQEKESSDKLVWALVLFVTGILGAVIYLFARKLPRKSARV